MTRIPDAAEPHVQEAEQHTALLARLREECSGIAKRRDAAIRAAVEAGARPPSVARRVSLSQTAVRKAAGL